MLEGWRGVLTSVATAGCLLMWTPARGEMPAASLPALVSLEQINLEEFEPAIRDQILRAHKEAAKEPQDASKGGRLGMIFQVYGKYELAETCYLRARALDPRSFRWAYYLGHVQGLLGKQTQAIESIGGALRIDSGYAPARVRLAQLLFDAGDTEGSARVYREVIDHNPDLAPAYFGWGQGLAAREDWAGAIESYRRACEIARNYAPAQYALAMAYRKAGDLDKARAHLELYQRVKQTKQPSFDRLMDDVKALYSGGLTHFAKGSVLSQQGKLQEAAAEFESALEVNPGLVMAHVNLIAMYGQLGLPDKAEQHYRAAVELDPGWVEIYYNWGMFQLQHGKKTEAAEMFRKAIEVNPAYADAHTQLASLLDEAGRLEEAAGHYQRALAVNPDHRQAHFLFAYNLIRSGQTDEAIKHFLETIRVEDSRTPVCMQALAIAYERAGNRERALEYLHQARERAAAFGMQDLVSQLQRDLNRLTAEGARP